MNWKEISEEYPNAWKEFIQYDPESKVTALLYHRELYSFFDELNIDVEVRVSRKRGAKKANFIYVVRGRFSIVFDSRDKAEYAAFETAFEMLECEIKGIEFLS